MPWEVNLNLFGESTGSQQLSDVSSYWQSLRLALFALFCRAGGGAGWWCSVVATRLKTPVFCKLEDTCLWWTVGVWLLHLLGASVVTQIPIAVAHLRTDSISLMNLGQWKGVVMAMLRLQAWISLLDPVCAFFRGASGFPPDTITLSILTNLPVASDSFCCSLTFLSVHAFLQLCRWKRKIWGQKLEKELKWKSQLTLTFPCTSLLRY